MATGFIYSATGFMPYFISLLLLLACTPAAAADVALVGVIGDKAAVLAVDGGDPKTVEVGQKWSGITVLGVEKERATVEIDRKQGILVRGHDDAGEANASRPGRSSAA